MTTNRKILLAIAVIALTAGSALAQTDTEAHTVSMSVPTINVLAITPNENNVALAVQAPGTPGAAPTGAANASKFLQYTVVTATTAVISIQYTETDSMLAGCHLEALAAMVSGSGTPSVARTLTNASDQTFITAIASGATGTAAGDGANVTLTLVVDTPASLVAGDTAAGTITYTFL